MKMIFVLISLLAVQAQAQFPFVGNITTSSKIKNNLACTDFTGKWEGTCTYTSSGQTHTNPSDIEFEMWSCDTVVINRTSYPVAGLKTESSSSSQGNYSSIVNFEWNDSARKQFFNFNYSSKSINYNLDNKNDKYESVGLGSFKISSGKLYMSQTINNNSSLNCEYGRK